MWRYKLNVASTLFVLNRLTAIFTTAVLILAGFGTVRSSASNHVRQDESWGFTLWCLGSAVSLLLPLMLQYGY